MTEFNATLGRYLNGLSGKVFHIEGFTSTARKHIQLGSFGSHMINGVANFLINGKMIPDKISISVIFSNLDQINMIFDSPKLELKNPIAGQIKFVNDDHGNNIEISPPHNFREQLPGEIISPTNQSM